MVILVVEVVFDFWIIDEMLFFWSSSFSSNVVIFFFLTVVELGLVLLCFLGLFWRFSLIFF